MTAPAEVFPVCDFLSEEMEAQGWTLEETANRMPGERAENLCRLQLLMLGSEEIILDEDTAAKLGAVFNVSAEYFLHLDRAWRGQWKAIAPLRQMKMKRKGYV